MKSLKSIQGCLVVLVIALTMTTNVLAGGRGNYPLGPDRQLTPGTLCNHPDTYRYPEHIAYCERNVSTETKSLVIQTYNRQLGYRIEAKDRSQYKIDHYIPLCAGGSNDESNLWPQHRSVYTVTDPLEGAICEKMLAGKLLQNKAVQIIREAKDNLDRVPVILKEVQDL